MRDPRLGPDIFPPLKPLLFRPEELVTGWWGWGVMDLK